MQPVEGQVVRHDDGETGCRTRAALFNWPLSRPQTAAMVQHVSWSAKGAGHGPAAG